MKKNLLKLMLVGVSTLTLASCGGGSNTTSQESVSVSTSVDSSGNITYVKPADNASTAEKVAYASKISAEELEACSKAEMEASDDTFKVLGLTSALTKACTQLSEKYEWLRISDSEDGTTKANMYVKNDYKDYTLLTALEPATDTYVADYALVQDARSIADYAAAGILYNYIPSDAADYGLDADGTEPLQGIHFNKCFWTNSNFTNVTGKTLWNVWQLAGSDSETAPTRKDLRAGHETEDVVQHISNVSFQSPVTEQINKSFLLSVEAPENQARIEAAYKSYYGKDWDNSSKYANCGTQWVTEFIANVSRFHSSDGTAMKETQLKDDWTAGYVYYGAFSKMKDAAGKNYVIAGQDTDPILKNLIADADFSEKNEAGETVTVKKASVNAMKTVQWDYDIEGFDGYFYTMYSQIVNNAKHPYTACLFARYMLDPTFYTKTIYNSSTPNSDGTKGNQYGYYYPGTMTAYVVGADSSKVYSNDQDWTKAKWKEEQILEDYSYLKDVRSAKSAAIDSLIASNTKAK